LLAPVESNDEGRVSLAGGLKRPVSGLVDVDLVVVGSDGAHGVVWREGDALVPFLWFVEGVEGRVTVSDSSYLTESAVGGNYEEMFVDGNSS